MIHTILIFITPSFLLNIKTATDMSIPTLLKPKPNLLTTETFMKYLINRCYAMENTLTRVVDTTVSTTTTLIKPLSHTPNQKLLKLKNNSQHKQSLHLQR